MIITTAQEIPRWAWGTSRLEPGQPAKLLRLAHACNDAALLVGEAHILDSRASEMEDREPGGPLLTFAQTWAHAAMRYFDTMMAAYADLAAHFAAEATITACALLNGEGNRRIPVPIPSTILSKPDLWLPPVMIHVKPPLTSDWAEERNDNLAAAHAEVHRTLNIFRRSARLLHGAVTAAFQIVFVPALMQGSRFCSPAAG